VVETNPEAPVTKTNLEELIAAYGGPMKLLRNAKHRPEQLAPYSSAFYPVGPAKPEEFSDWATEQKAWHETAVLFDLNHHMTEIAIRGRDARKLVSSLAINSPDNFHAGRASQMALCNAEGSSITDGILYSLENDEFNFVGPNIAVDWIEFQGTTGGFDVELARDERSPGYADGRAFNRRHYRYQIQGPSAVKVIEKLTGRPFPDVKFFHYAPIQIGGITTTALRHGMVGAAGLELFGPFEQREEVRNAIIEAGREFGLSLVGTRAYFTNPLESGWLPVLVPAIYSSESTRAFRKWMPATHPDALFSLEGSYYSEHIEDYYVTPFMLGYHRIIKFDHDFIGSDALKQMDASGSRKKVTLAWNGEDVAQVFAAMLTRGDDTVKTLDLPVVGRVLLTDRSADAVLRDGKLVGVSFLSGYISTERTILSLAIVDNDVEVGDELVLLWGEAGGHNDTPVKPTKLFEIRATVTPTPYSDYAREHYRG
jgi:vanillate/3-O-methylgallate O-demethylase